jgi:hypothetical protein
MVDLLHTRASLGYLVPLILDESSVDIRVKEGY